MNIRKNLLSTAHCIANFLIKTKLIKLNKSKNLKNPGIILMQFLIKKSQPGG